MYNDAARDAIYKGREANYGKWQKYHNQQESERYLRNKSEILTKKKQKYLYSCFLNNRSIKKEFELLCSIDF